jgi:manganese-dependent ADP-ribose/CDP-alcohol diphosphatase
MSLLCQFGIIADVQYADVEDGFDFTKTQRRHYRNALRIAAGAFAKFRAERCDFVLNLGDICDRKAMSNPDEALTRVFSALDASDEKETPMTCHHLIGNHELYLFSRSDLRKNRLGQGRRDKWYYAFDAHAKLRVIVLDSYLFCCIARDDTKGNEEAFALLEQRNPNDVRSDSVDWSKDLVGLDRRWMPYNGAFGAEQRRWLADELLACATREQRAIVVTHCPVAPGSCVPLCLAWDYDEVLAVLHDQRHRLRTGRPVVCAVFAGHDHDGGETTDAEGIYHRTLISPLIPKPGDVAFLTATLHADRLEIVGHGVEKGKILHF